MQGNLLERWNEQLLHLLFYIPDIEYTVMDAEKNDITYQPITVELIEY